MHRRSAMTRHMVGRGLSAALQLGAFAAQGCASEPYAVCRPQPWRAMGSFRNLPNLPLNGEVLSHASRGNCISLFTPALRGFGQQKLLIGF